MNKVCANVKYRNFKENIYVKLSTYSECHTNCVVVLYMNSTRLFPDFGMNDGRNIYVFSLIS